MSDILFVTWDGGGNVPPATAIARELQARGHTVRFLGHASQTAALSTAGLEVVKGRHARRFSSQDTPSPVDVLMAFGDRGMGADLLEAVAERPADLVVVDCLMFGALDVARRSGMRYVVLEHLYDDYYARGCLGGPMGLSLGLRRLRPHRALDAAAARLVAALPELDRAGPARRPANLRHIGPVVDVAPRVAGEPTVLVSLSTFGFRGMARSLQNVVDATAALDARVVVTTGPAIDPAVVRPHARVEVHRYVPHVELMPRASMLVGHGGHGTTMQALAHDLPVVVMPMDRMTDQPRVGRSLVEAGAGRLVAKKASPDQLEPVIAELLAPGPHRDAAARLGKAIRSMPGAGNGADAIEEVLRNGAPAPGRRAARP